MNVRTYREKRGSIEDAARALQVTPGYLSQLERGLKWPGPFIIRKIFRWSKGAVTAQDIFDNLDWTQFATKPIRVKGGATEGATSHGESNGEVKGRRAKKT